MRSSFLQALVLGGVLAACSSGPASEAAGKATPVTPFVTTALAKFDSPFGMVFLPDGSALVTEKAGKLKLWRNGQPIGDVVGVPRVAAVEQGGLLGIALSPHFASDRLVYLAYSEPSAAGGSGLTLALGALAADGSRLIGVRMLWHDPQGGKGGQFGAAIAFAPDGNSLFLSSGERQRFTPAQDPNQPLGKILHLTLDGQPAPDNPGPGALGTTTTSITTPPDNSGTARSAAGRLFRWPSSNRTPAETWSTGHRNPYGLAFDAAGRLWESEMGPQGGDEINLIKRGLNYGWPNASNGSNYDDTDIPDHKPGDGYEPPKVWWKPSISPGGLMIYSGGKWPQWKGDAFLPALSAQALVRVHLEGDTATKAEQWDLSNRIRAIAQSPAGDIYLLEDGDGGRLLRLDPAKPQTRR